MKLAPVYLSVYDRLSHLRACVESLKRNSEAEKTTLFIASDGPRCRQSAALVAQVREYIRSIDGFQHVVSLMPRENTNKAVRMELFHSMLESNERFIASEDDNVFSPYFLKFVNDCLERYSDTPDVAAVCGYNFPGFPADQAGPQVLVLRCFAGWGWGGWRDREIAALIDHRAFARKILKNKPVIDEINSSLPHLVPMLKSVSKGNLNAGDVVRCSLLYLRRKVCIFPSHSLVRNTGHDGSGEHCKINNQYSQQSIWLNPISLHPLVDLSPKDSHARWLYHYFGGDLVQNDNKKKYSYSVLGNMWLILSKLVQKRRTSSRGVLRAKF